MSDRSAAEAYGAVFTALAEMSKSAENCEQGELIQKIAERVLEEAEQGDFTLDQCDCVEAFARFGFDFDFDGDD